MLPTVLSDALCSLQEGQPRFAFTMDVIVGENGEIDADQITFSNTLIEVKKNYRYEECAMYDDKIYIDLFNLTKTMDKTASNSHDVVGFWMVYMNKVCAKRMVELKIGIFRSVILKTTDVFNKSLSEALTPDCKRVIQTWHNTIGQYVAFSDVAVLDHQIMNESSYIHITSPIRRLVDLLNQMLFLSHGNPAFLSKDAAEFLDKWMSNLEYVNTSMRSIRKVQTDCDLLHKCSVDPDIMKTVHDGIIFDMISKTDKSVTFMVYLEDLKLLSRVILLPGAEIENYAKAKFRLYLFEDEDKTKRKIRLQMV
jgi:exoribonuclease R